MKFVVVFLAIGYTTTIIETAPSLLPVNPGGIGGIFKGPNSEYIIKGPDGSVITAAAEGGAVSVAPKVEPVIVAEPEVLLPPVTPTVAIVTEPKVLLPPAATSNVAVLPAPIIQAEIIAEPVATAIVKTGDVHRIDAEIVDPPVIEPKQNSDLIGPSGSITTRGSSSIVSGPSSTTISGPAVVGPPIVGTVLEPLGIPVAAPIDSIPVATPIKAVASSPIIPISSTIIPPLGISTADNLPITGLAGAAVPLVQSSGSNGILSTLAAPVDQGGLSIVSSTTLAPPIGQLPSLSTPIQNNPDQIVIDQIAIEKQLQEEQAIVNQRQSLEQELANRKLQEATNKAVLEQQLQTQAAANQAALNRQLQAEQLAVNQATLHQLIPVDSRQLQINPSLIPTANIVAPEIGHGLTSSLSNRRPVLFEPNTRPVTLLPDGRELGLSSASTISPKGVSPISNIQGGLIASDGSILPAGAINGVPNNIRVEVNDPVVGPQRTLAIEDHPLLASALRSDGLDISKLTLSPVQLSPPDAIIPPSIGLNSIQTSSWGRIGRGIKKDKDKK